MHKEIPDHDDAESKLDDAYDASIRAASNAFQRLLLEQFSQYPELSEKLQSRYERLRRAGVVAGVLLQESLEEVQAKLPAALARQGPAKESGLGSVPTDVLLRRLRAKRAASDRYRPGSEVGRGGMGTILEAVDEDLGRVVAVKAARESSAILESSRVLGKKTARLLDEAQITASLEHPGVIPVHDLGLDSSGRLYFVMRLVKGSDFEKVIQWAHEGNQDWSLARVLGLLLRACEAMSYAHHRDVVHRDLKPANIMVGEFGEVYVMDWGLAKVLGHEDKKDLRLRTEMAVVEGEAGREPRADVGSPLLTGDGDVVGTPAYMSPEQARGNVDAMGPATDVYAVGAILYHLISGQRPYVASGEETDSHSILGRVREGPPVPVETLNPKLPAELVAICEKAMAREISDRYPDMGALSKDLRAYLEGHVVHAYEVGPVAELRKWVKRNRGMAAAMAAAVLAVIAGAGLFAWKANEAEIASRDAKRQRDAAVLAEKKEAEQRARADERAVAAEKAEKAERERAEQLRQVSEFQSQMLEQIDTTEAGLALMKDLRERFTAAIEKVNIPHAERRSQSETLNRLLLRINATDTAAALIDRTILRPAVKAIDEQFKDQPLVDAQLRQALADLYRMMGQNDAAYPLQKSALTTRRRVLGEENTDTLRSASGMGQVLHDSGDAHQAELYFRDVLEKRRRVLGESHRDTLASVNNVGYVLRALGSLAEAEHFHREALEKRRRVLGEDDPDTIQSLNNLGFLLMSRGKLNEAMPYLREALEKRQRILGGDHPRTLDSINNFGLLLKKKGDLDEAEQYWREALQKRRRVLGDEHPRTLTSISNMGGLLESQGKLSEAESYYRDALEKRRRVLGEDHPDTLVSLSRLGSVCKAQGRLDEAEPYYREDLEKSRRILGEEHPDTIASISLLGTLLVSQGKLSEAELCYHEALEKQRRVMGEEHPDTLRTISRLGSLRKLQGQFVEAERLYREALEKRRRVLGEEHPETLDAISNMGSFLESQGKLAEAEHYYREVVEKSRRALGEDHPDTLVFISNMGSLMASQGKLSEAAWYYRMVLEKRTRLLGMEDQRTFKSMIDLAGVVLRQGNYLDVLELITPSELVARRVLVGDKEEMLARLLLILGRAQFGRGIVGRLFDAAEVNLLDAHAVFARTQGAMSSRTVDCAKELMNLYGAWHAAEPGKGYDAKASEWEAKLEAAMSKPATLPAAEKK